MSRAAVMHTGRDRAERRGQEFFAAFCMRKQAFDFAAKLPIAGAGAVEVLIPFRLAEEQSRVADVLDTPPARASRLEGG